MVASEQIIRGKSPKSPVKVTCKVEVNGPDTVFPYSSVTVTAPNGVADRAV